MPASVGVTPPEGLRRRSELFRVLASVFAVEFVPRENGAWSGLDALIVLGRPDALEGTPRGLPVLVFTGEESHVREGTPSLPVEFAASPRVDRRLRGRRLDEDALGNTNRLAVKGACLASNSGRPVWVAVTNDVEAALLAPAELDPDESLRDRFRSGRFLALLPLLELLRRATAYDVSVRPPSRAAFLLDDPNLHWRTYGYVDFGRLAEHARRHSYHLSFATVPFDLWRSSRSAARIFRDAGETLSLALHGNDHTYQELAAPLAFEEALALFDQAVDRVRRFERRTRIGVSRVMIPPHGLCADRVLGPMLAAGIEALCRAPGWSDEWDEARRRTARWFPADISPAGAPILGRHLISGPRWRDEVTLDLYLDQPAVVYGHHYDLARGYGILADGAEWLNGFQGLSWHSLAELARGNVVARQEGSVLRVDAFTRRAVIGLAEDVRSVDIVFPEHLATSEDVLFWNGRGLADAHERRIGRLVRRCPGGVDGRTASSSADDPWTSRRGDALDRARLLVAARSSCAIGSIR